MAPRSKKLVSQSRLGNGLPADFDFLIFSFAVPFKGVLFSLFSPFSSLLPPFFSFLSLFPLFSSLFPSLFPSLCGGVRVGQSSSQSFLTVIEVRFLSHF